MVRRFYKSQELHDNSDRHLPLARLKQQSLNSTISAKVVKQMFDRKSCLVQQRRVSVDSLVS